MPRIHTIPAGQLPLKRNFSQCGEPSRQGFLLIFWGAHAHPCPKLFARGLGLQDWPNLGEMSISVAKDSGAHERLPRKDLIEWRR